MRSRQSAGLHVAQTPAAVRGPTRRAALLALPFILAACGRRAPDLVAGEEGRIARIQDGDALALDTGLRVRLAEVEAPAIGYRDRPGDPFAEESAAILSAAALGRRARLYYGGLSRDRYDRAIAHAIASDETGADFWLNGLIVRRGGARVRTFPDNARRVRQLYALEAEARAARRGLWALDDYAIRSRAADLPLDGFVIFEGVLAEIRSDGQDAEARFDGDAISVAAAPTLGEADAELDLVAGSRVRIRGRIDRRGPQPLMRLTHWGQIEMVGS